MDATQEILSTIPLDQLAAQLGTDEATAQNLASQLIPALLGGMSANAADDGGARSLASALSDHANSSLLDGGVSLDKVDTRDGEAIVQNVFGARTPDVTQALGRGVAGGNNEMVQKLLRILAPIVLAYVASKLTKGGSGSSGGSGGGILGGILDSILGGGRQQTPAQVPQQPTGGSLQDILLDMLGGAMGGGAAAPQRQPQQPSPRQPEFEQPRQQPQQAPANPDLDGPAAPTIPIDEPAASPQGRPQQPGGFGGQGGGILGDLLGGLLGGGRRA